MAVQVNDSGIIKTTVKEFPIIAVNVLDKLGYQVQRASKQLDQILAIERLDEQIGHDWWRQEYRVVIQWMAAKSGGVVVTIELEEKKGGASESDCQKRCDKIIFALRKDAERAAHTLANREKSTAYGAARWGTEAELEANGYYQSKPDPKRLIIGRTEDNQYIQVPELWTYAHALICGRTGVGKSRAFFIPQLIERVGASMIVTEATPGYEAGELYALTSGWRKMAGHQIYCFNPSDMSSHRINPIDTIKRAPEHMKTQLAEKLADLVIMNGESTDGKTEQTWNRSEKLLLIPLLLHAAAGDPEQGHFGALRWLLLQGPDKLAKVLERSASGVAQMEFEGWMRLSGETNFKYGVFSGLITKLNPWMTDQMVALTEKTDIDLDAMANELFTFYIAVPSRSRDSKLIGSLMVNFLMDHILEIRTRMKYPLTMLLDEFTNFGKISGIGDTLSIIRKNKIGLILGFQNYAQLEQVYNRREAQIIMDMPATQIYFKQKKFEEARDLAEAIGRTTIEEATLNDSGRVHELIQGRHLITPDELISLNKEVIVFTADVKPIKLALTSPTAYEQALSYEPPERQHHEISEFIKKRGRTSRDQEPVRQAEQKPKQQPGQRPISQPKRGPGRDRKPAGTAPRQNQEPVPKPHHGPKHTEGPPEYDDI